VHAGQSMDLDLRNRTTVDSPDDRHETTDQMVANWRCVATGSAVTDAICRHHQGPVPRPHPDPADRSRLRTTPCGGAGRGNVPKRQAEHAWRAPGDLYGVATARYRSSPSRVLGVDRGVDRCPQRSQGHVCVHSMPREASLLVRRVLRTSVLLIICRSWVRAPPAPPRMTCGGVVSGRV
jgi:hypothetical protein